MLKKIGTIHIDTGTILIGDPCTIIDDERLHSPKGWSKFIDEVLVPMDKEMKSSGNAKGKIISFTGGDKSCNVYAVIKDKETKQIIINLQDDSDFPPPHFAFFE